MYKVGLLPCIALAALPAAALAQAAEAARVSGEVMFVSGSAEKLPAAGAPVAVAKGGTLAEGDRIRTGPDSHVYVRLRDGGLLVVRPSSELRIDLWRYDPARPAESRIKYTLDSGVARSVSGEGAKAARDKFRFNTPMAAIGVRGTDFTVLADPAVTRVAVQSGGVIVNGFGEGCRADGLGPCEGPSSVELFASAKEKLLQLKLGERRPELIDDTTAGPDKTRPSAPGEPVAGQPLSGGVNLADARGSEVASQVLPVPPTPVPVVTPPAPDPAIAAWGRWAAFAKTDTGVVDLQALMNRGQMVAINKLYALVSVGTPGAGYALPGAGTANFTLAAHEGYITDKTNGQSVASTASDGRLGIDFGTRRFDTSMTVSAGSVSTQVAAKGSIEANGSFLSDPFIYPSVVQGIVGGANASQAMYIYQRKIDSRYDAAGATSWRK